MKRSRLQWSPFLALAIASAACSVLAPNDSDLLGAGAAPAAGGSASGGDASPGLDAGGDAASTAGGTAGANGAAGAAGEDGPAAGGSTGSDGASGSSGGTNPSDAADPDGGAGSLISRRQLLLWLTADDGVTTAGSAVTAWSDQSPNGADATQSIAVSRPDFSREGELDSVAFDGVDDALVLPRGFADFTDGLSFFAVTRVHAEHYCPSILHLSNDPEEDDIAIGRHEGSILYEVQNGSLWGPAGAFEIGPMLMLTAVHSTDGGIELRINGQFMASDNFPLPANRERANNFLGRSLYPGCAFFDGRISEILLYARAVDLPERESIEAYLRTKWLP